MMLNFDIQNHKPLREMVYEELKMLVQEDNDLGLFD